MGGAGVHRPPSLICPQASAWRAGLVPFVAWRALRPDSPFGNAMFAATHRAGKRSVGAIGTVTPVVGLALCPFRGTQQ